MGKGKPAGRIVWRVYLTFGWLSYKESFFEAEKEGFQAASKGVKRLRLLNERENIKDVSAHIHNKAGSQGMCHTIGPLKHRDMARDIVAGLRKLGKEGSIRTDKQKVQYAHWVYLESMPDDELDRIIVELEANDSKDYHKNDRNELSLGIYNGFQGDKQQQHNIAALGYSPLVGPMYRTVTQYWIDVADMNYNTLNDDAWKIYLDGYPEVQRKSAKCELINA
jgi:hypothetical protein